MTLTIKTATLSAGLVLALIVGPGTAEAAGKHGGGRGFDFGEPGKAADVVRTIDVLMTDNLFEPATVSVEVGETVRFRLRNTGEFLHEFGIGTSDMHEAHRAEMREMMKHGMIEADRVNDWRLKMEHVGGPGNMAHDDPNSVLVEPWKEAEVVWKFTKAMVLEFACNVPGHYELGMVGEIRVDAQRARRGAES